MNPPVTWTVALAVVIVLLLVARRKRSSAAPASLRQNPTERPASDRKFASLKALEGAACIYEEGAYILSGRLVQAEESGSDFLLAVKILRAEGLSDFPEERIHLGVSKNQLDVKEKFLHSRQTNWRLFFDRDLIATVLSFGRSGTDHKAIKRVLLEHQMK